MKKIVKKFTKRKWGASLTVEACLLLPVFVFSLTALFALIEVMNLQQKIQFAMTQVLWEASEYAYAYQMLCEEGEETEKEMKNAEEMSGDSEEKDTTGEEGNIQKIVKSIRDGTFYAIAFREYVDTEELNDSVIAGGCNGISFYGSEFMEDGETIRVTVTYRVRVLSGLIFVPTIKICQNVSGRAFVGCTSFDGSEKEKDTGEQAEEAQDEMVYLTKTGTKYHCSARCSYLKAVTTVLFYSECETARNSSGAKYYPCESCMEETNPDLVYITAYGARYHATSSCRHLEKDVTKMTKSEAKAQGKSPCSKCAKAE